MSPDGVTTAQQAAVSTPIFAPADGITGNAVAEMVRASVDDFEQLNAETLDQANQRFSQVLHERLTDGTVMPDRLGEGSQLLVNELTDHPDVVVKRLGTNTTYPTVRIPPDGRTIEQYWAKL